MKKGYSLIEVLVVFALITMLATIGAYGLNIVRDHASVSVTSKSLDVVEDAQRVYFERNSTWTKDASVLSSMGSVSATEGESSSEQIVSIFFDFQRNLWLAVKTSDGVCLVREVKDPLSSSEILNSSFDGTCTASVVASLSV